MKLRVSMILAIMVTLFFVTGSTSWARNHIANRQAKHFKRIGQGVICGKIAHDKFIHLNRKQWRIQRAKRQALKRLHFRHHPVYHVYNMNGIFTQPTWRVGWSFVWR